MPAMVLEFSSSSTLLPGKVEVNKLLCDLYNLIDTLGARAIKTIGNLVYMEDPELKWHVQLGYVVSVCTILSWQWR